MKQNKFMGKRIDNGEWCYGSLITNISNQTFIALNDSTYSIKGKSDIVNSYVFEVEPNTISQSTGLIDAEYNDIYFGQDVLFLGMQGKICFECGSFGIGFKECIDYNIIQECMDNDSNCCGNKYNGCFNDNFMSLWEIYNAFNCDGKCLYPVKVIEVNDEI